MNNLQRLKFKLTSANIFSGFRATFSAWISVVLVFGLVIILISNLVRILDNTQANILVYEAELKGLKELQDKNSEFLDQLSYYQSQEYKRIYARNALKLGDSNEKFYDIQEPLEVKKIKRAQRSIFPAADYTSFWLFMIQ